MSWLGRWGGRWLGRWLGDSGAAPTPATAIQLPSVIEWIDVGDDAIEFREV